MKESSLTIHPAAAKIATGAAIGMCVGYAAAPGQYSLKKLLTLDNDTFSKLFPKKKMNADEIKALDTIKKASKEFLASGRPEQEKVKTAAKEWYKKFKAVPIDETLKQNLINKKQFLHKVAEDNNIILIRKYYTLARELLLEDLDNKFMHEYFSKMKKQLQVATANLKEPIEDYKKVVREAYRQRVKNLKLLPNRGVEVKQSFENLKKAYAAKRTVSANKLFEIVNRFELKKAYKTVSKFLPKARTRAALNGALLLSTLTAMGIIFFNPSPQHKK